MSFKGAKKRFQTTNETNYEKKPISSCGRRRDRAGRLCHYAGTSWPRRCRALPWPRVRPSRGSPSKLNLTADQQTKVQPILDATKPQIATIHQEAMQKMKTVMDGALSQIRPLLTPEQQTKFDAIQKAHQDMMNARERASPSNAGITSVVRSGGNGGVWEASPTHLLWQQIHER